ncbi:MAG: hypothetical protein AAGC60_24650 [Acidobacteriota bacterium]
MTDFRLDDIPTLDTAVRRGRQTEADPEIAAAYAETRILARGPRLGAAALALGLESADLLTRRVFSRDAQAAAVQAMSGAGPSYSIYTDCGPYNYNGTCNEPCFGFAPHHMDPFYCATCAEQAADPTNNPAYFWHFVGSRGSLSYIDREPDVCAGRDAWKWDVGACGDCAESAVYRCHDGWKIYSDNSMDPTICEGLISCDSTLRTC